MFMYIEDDTDVTWPALLSWAADTKVLEPLGFLRHFWRTEISNFTGNPVFLVCKAILASEHPSVQVILAPCVALTA